MEGVTIRAATIADQPFISEMQYEAFFVPPAGAPDPRTILDEPNIVKYHVGFGTRPGDVGVIAEDPTGRPLGAAWVRLIGAWVRLIEGYGFVDDDTPELGIAVVPGARGRGLGSALMAALLSEVPRCSCSVDTRNPAMHLYERLGFRHVRDDGAWSAVMVREAA